MKTILRNKKITTFALVLLMASVLLTVYAPVKAQIDERPGQSGPLPPGVTVDWEFHPIAYISFTPNPIGVGQQLLVNLFVKPPPSHQRFMQDYTVTITDPDGNEDVIVMDSYVADGTAWFPYVPDQVGTWTLQFDFLGMYFPAGYYDDGDYSATSPAPNWVYYDAHYFHPYTDGPWELVVQEELVPSWHRDLPTDYWTRPISLENREWYTIAGNYPWQKLELGGEFTGEKSYYGPYITAPNTSHVAWKVLRGLAGIHGGEPGVYGITDNPSTPDVIYAGRCYDTYYKPGVGNVAACFDLRTGEIYWEIPTAEGGVTPNWIHYRRGTSEAVPGATETNTIFVDLIAVGGSSSNRDTLYKINEETGAVSEYNIEGAGRILFYRDGHFLSVRDSGNSETRDAIVNQGLPGLPTYLYNWTVAGSTNNFANRLVTNQSFWLVPSYRGSAWPPSSRYRFYGRLGTVDVESGVTAITRRFHQDQVWGGSYIGVSLKTGQILYNKTTAEAPFSPSTTVADNGKFFIYFSQGIVRAYDIKTGQQLWENRELRSPPGSWAEWAGYHEAAAYNMIYWWTYAGVVAMNQDTGDIEWIYTSPATPFETPYLDMEGNPSMSITGRGIVADGKIYVRNNEHTPTAPYTRGWGFHCIDAFTGEKIWSIAGAMNPGAAADGYITAGNTYDGYMYVFGKGKSATTIEAPMTAIPLGQSVVLKGTVLDQSPGQPGTPCVSKESMDDWMNYIHMQRPIPTDVTGVPVSLDTLDPNGNFIHIADITTDGYSGTFGYTWTPEVPGTYAVTATFMGDESYGSSFAQTYVGVGEAPEPYPEPPEYGSAEWPEYPEPADDTPIFLGLTAAIVVVAILVVYDIFFRKR